MATLTAVMNVYNEADVLPFFEAVLRNVDSAIVIDGGPLGASTDGTFEMLENYSKFYPMKLMQGIFRRKNHGGYDHGGMRNAALNHVQTTHFLYHHADVVYGDGSLQFIREALDNVPGKAVYYSPMVDFYIDKYHCLMRNFALEEQLPRALSGDSLVYGMSYKPEFAVNVSGINLGEAWDMQSTVWIPQAVRYHLCFTRPFAYQVEKQVRRITQGEWASVGSGIVARGFDAVLKAAIKAVEDYPKQASFDYCQVYPDCLQDYESTAFDGKEEFFDNIDFHTQRLRPYYENLAQNRN